MQAPPFDLQAQQEKLARFEEKLRLMKSAALYPQLLGAKWKQLHEQQADQERRRQREVAPHGADRRNPDALDHTTSIKIISAKGGKRHGGVGSEDGSSMELETKRSGFRGPNGD